MRADEERVAAAKAEIPPAAFSMPLDRLGLKEHVFNILVEAGFETIGDLMMSLKLDENRVLGLAGVGPKAIQNIHEQLDAMTFPEVPVEVPVAIAAEEQAQAAVAMENPVEAVAAPSETQAATDAATLSGVQELPAAEKAAKAAKPAEEEVEPENAKDGVSLDELFKMKPEIFRTSRR